MAYSKAQAKKIAEQIHSRFGGRIAAATEGTPVPPEFVAGLIGVEAGKDRQGRISETATRFEPHVFAKLQAVRDGKLKQYSRITKRNIIDASDEALKALAHSYGLTQIMGWWTIHLGGTIADLRDPQKHLSYTVKLLMLNSKGDFEREEFAGEFKQWNTGSETGKTYHADYVANATAVMEAYSDLDPVEPIVTNSVTEETKVEETSASPQPEPEIKTQEPEPPAALQAPKPTVTPVEAPPTSITTKIAATAGAIGPVIAATGLKIGGVEFSTGGIVAIAGVIIVGMVLGAWIWNQSQERRERRQRLSMENLASDTKSNVIAAGSKV